MIPLASSRVYIESVPVRTNVMPVKRESDVSARLVMFTPQSLSRSTSDLVPGSEKNSTALCDITLPKPSIFRMSSSDAFITPSSVPKEAFAPILSIPRAKRSLERSLLFDFSIAFIRFAADFSPCLSRAATASAVSR